LESFPGAFSLNTEEDYLVLARVKIQTQSGLYIPFSRPVMTTGKVIDMDDESPPFRVSDFEEFHTVQTSKRELGY
jgi:hypothetical protein